MKRSLLKRASKAAAAELRRVPRWFLRRRLHSALAGLEPLSAPAGAPVLLIDGLWDNPNHFLRLRLALEASHGLEPMALVAVLRTRTDVTRPLLETYGCRSFVYLEDTPASSFEEQARRLLSRCVTHRDLLNIELPGGVPAYIFYDTALKLARHPQPPLAHPVWLRALSTQLRDIAVAQQIFTTNRVGLCLLSHIWKSEYGALAWQAMSAGIPAIHITGYCESIRMRRLRSLADYLNPVEYLSYPQFRALGAEAQARAVALGRAYLQRRAAAVSTDINNRYAYRPDARIEDRDVARKTLAGISDGRPIGLISAHVWYDFPHIYAMSNFTDFLDWMRFTLNVAREVKDVVWLVKPHPTENWYGGFKLADVARDLPDHIKLLPTETDAQTALNATDVVVTVHGTIAIEAAAKGLPVITADRSVVTGWPFAEAALSRDDYERKLRGLATLSKLSARDTDLAAALMLFKFGEPSSASRTLVIKDDARGLDAYRDAITLLQGPRDVLRKEVANIKEFLLQDEHDAYAVHHVIKALGDSGSPSLQPIRQHDAPTRVRVKPV
jgi:hypothetical protein